MNTVPIVALDVPDEPKALALVRRLGDACDFYKIGGELFTACGPSVVDAVRREGKRVFLDLKFHDIPNTVRAASRSAATCGASLMTVHAVGGQSMVQAAVEGAGDQCGVLAVTVLTSMDGQALSESLGRRVTSVSDEVARLAMVAEAAGAHGVVCSGQEAARVVADHSGKLATLVPGVRLRGDSAQDQSRVVTPRDAAQAGATYVVLGRTVTAAADPVDAMRQVLAELSVPQAVLTLSNQRGLTPGSDPGV
jgi:orotidine-5'-phosphate decarboxylase